MQVKVQPINRNCEWLIKSVTIDLRSDSTWIAVTNSGF
jgi:hypothetical protein